MASGKKPQESSWHSPLTIAIVGVVGTIVGGVIGNTTFGELTIGATGNDLPLVGEPNPREKICFWHQNEPAGFRLMTRSRSGEWVERQPNGMVYVHTEIGRVTVGPWRGAILERTEHPKGGMPWPVQLFVPDRTAHNVLLFRQTEKHEWKYVSVLESSTERCPRRSAKPDDPNQVTDLLQH